MCGRFRESVGCRNENVCVEVCVMFSNAELDNEQVRESVDRNSDGLADGE